MAPAAVAPTQRTNNQLEGHPPAVPASRMQATAPFATTHAADALIQNKTLIRTYSIYRVTELAMNKVTYYVARTSSICVVLI